ncbi:MAG: sterol desaturase family protein [Bacteroidetes bacterium]|nr:sterol desaturase family protein [Bacteroidota bacterium]
MEAFSDLPPYLRTLLLASGLVLLWVLEGLRPLFALPSDRRRHAGLNLVLTLFQLVLGLLLASVIVVAADFVMDRKIGLLNLVDLPLWLDVLLGVLILDFVGSYLIHLVEHKVRWMWKFHLIHHTDQYVDVTTGLRHHPGETVFRSAFGMLAILVGGIPIGTFILYQTISVIFAQFEHANIRLPDGIDRLLSYVFVTPNMHKVHHHYVQPLTDTNYGNIFSIWDRVFRTYAQVDDPRTLRYGIDTHMDEGEHNSLSFLLKIPFLPYRPPAGSKFADEAVAKREKDETSD